MDDAKLRELTLKATAGPWTVGEAHASIECDEGPIVDLVTTEEDAVFIAAANPAEILARLDEKERLLERLEQEDARRATDRELTMKIAQEWDAEKARLLERIAALRKAVESEISLAIERGAIKPILEHAIAADDDAAAKSEVGR